MEKQLEILRKAFEVLKIVSSLDMTIVPIEPTKAMIDKALKVCPELSVGQIKELYAEMLLASDDSILI